MLALELSEFMVELKDGAINNVGPSTKETSAKLFDVERAEAREFGDKRVKFVFDDGEGNEVQVALFPEEVLDLVDDVDELREEGPVFE
jgi:peptidoglycan/xylan/chitin deacetylase (PgdA/CDA1 family)